MNMKGYRFYLEYAKPSYKKKATVKNPGKHQGNVFALQIGSNGGMGAVMFYPNSPVTSTTIESGYLRNNCKRISEKLAREIHPNLFYYLDMYPNE
jgi:hypothetical protein